MTSKHRSRSRSRRRVYALLAAAILLAVAALATEIQVSAAQAETGYGYARDRLDAALQAAQTNGFTERDLAPVAVPAGQLETVVDPLWISDRPGYYQDRASRLRSLLDQLGPLEANVLARYRTDASASLASAAGEISQATQLGADPQDLAPLHKELAGAEELEAAATEPRQLADVAGTGRDVLARARALSRARQADQTAIAAAATELLAQDAADPAKLRKAGAAALATGRDDASVAAYLRIAAVTRDYDQLERYGTALAAAGSDPQQLSIAAAGLQHYQQAIHSGLLGAFPHQVIVVSHQAQELWAYQDGKVVKDTLVTTGRPQLPTDLGAMKVLSKSSPFVMRSPWPRSSPWWYPDTKVQMVLWFTITGEGLHDAYWEWDSAYGPGSEDGGFASHGCIHVPLAAETFLYGWAAVGTPVIVFPGDGTSVANQVAQISVDADGNPTTGPKGV